MDKSVWKTLFGDWNTPAENTGQLWVRTIGAVVVGAAVAAIATWLYALITDGDVAASSMVSSMIGAGLGLGAVIYLNNRRRHARAQHVNDDVIDDLPKRLG